MTVISKLISGGQTGVDQGALRAALGRGIECGGWCPPGRECETGRIPEQFPLVETPLGTSPAAPGVPRSQRSEWNVRDSDGTLILRPASQPPDPGTQWTIECAARLGKPLIVCDPFWPGAADQIRGWLTGLAIKTLNVAGPSEASKPGIGEKTFVLMVEILGDAGTTDGE
jgi:hypothetical protein